MSDSSPKTTNPEEDFDPHRFSVEPKKKFDKKFVSVASSLGILGLLIAGTIFFGKWQMATYFENLTKAREDVAADPASTPENASTTASITLPKFEVQKEPDKTSSVAGQNAIPVINEPRQSKDTPEIGKNAPRADEKEQAKPVIPMMLESAAAPVKKEVLSVAPQSVSNRQAEATVSNPTVSNPTVSNRIVSNPTVSFSTASNVISATAPSGKPRTVESMAAAKAEQAAISATAQSTSAEVGDRSRVILRGSFIECILESQLISNIPGISSCIVPANVYSDNGKRLLIKKGSKLVGEYAATVALGDSRFGIMWKRLKTPEGVVIDVDSAASDGLGAMGVEGVFDSNWAARLGTAFMFSVIADGISTATTPRVTGTTGGTVGTTGTNPVQQSATVDLAQTFSKAQIAQAMQISPTFFKNRGDRVSVFVNRDLWFNN